MNAKREATLRLSFDTTDSMGITPHIKYRVHDPAIVSARSFELLAFNGSKRAHSSSLKSNRMIHLCSRRITITKFFQEPM